MALFDRVRPDAGNAHDSYHMTMARGWWVDLCWYSGLQSMEERDVLENLDPGLLMERTGYVANHILRMVSGNVSRLTQPRVDWSVIPKTPDQPDQEGAKYAQHLLDHCYDSLGFAEKRIELALWVKTTGTAFVYANWDPAKGEAKKAYFDPFTQQPTNAGMLTPEQKQYLDAHGLTQTVTDGDYECEVLSPFQVIMPWWCKSMDRMPWVLIRKVMSLDEVWDRWPKIAPEIGPDEMDDHTPGNFWRRVATLSSHQTSLFGQHTSDEDAVLVDELWIPPSARFPEGLTAMATKKRVLQHGPHQFRMDGLDCRFPLVDYFNFKIPGRYHGMSDVEHLISAQRDYNRGRQQVSQIRDIMGVPQIIAPKGSLGKNHVRNDIGDVIEYDGMNGKPEFLQGLQMPPSVNDSVMQSFSDMQTMSGFSDASLGNMPQGARSGNAVALLQERDNMTSGPVVQSQEHSFERLGSLLLKIGHRYMKMPRAITIYGQTRQADVKWFKGASLNGNTRVRVKPGSMTPKSRVETFERLTQLSQFGILNPADPKDRRLMLEALEVGGIEKLFQVEDGARRRARIENMMFARPDMAQGFAFPDVDVFDDHQGHYEEHLAFMQTDEFELLPPLRKQFFKAHVQKHTMAVADAMQAAATVQAAMGGGGKGSEPKQPGEASQPASKNPTPGQTSPASAA